MFNVTSAVGLVTVITPFPVASKTIVSIAAPFIVKETVVLADPAIVNTASVPEQMC
jgi:hypothetical protein